MGLPAYPIRVQVIAHDPENDGFYAMTPSGQILPLVRRLYDHADGLRIKKPPMPVRGSWGMVMFPGGDIRNPHWMGAYHPNLVDSLPSDASDPFSDYESNFDGSYSYRHGVSGFWGQQWADNSSFVMGTSGLGVPELFRHTVTSGQARQRVKFNQSERNPSPQKPFGWAFQQSVSGEVGGLKATCDASGNFTLQAGTSGRTFTVNFNDMTIVVSTSGVTITTTGDTPITLDSKIVLVTGNVFAKGDVRAGFTTPAQVTLLGHDHSKVKSGEDQTGPPVSGT